MKFVNYHVGALGCTSCPFLDSAFDPVLPKRICLYLTREEGAAVPVELDKQPAQCPLLNGRAILVIP